MTDWKSEPPDRREPSAGRPEPGAWLPPKLREKLDEGGGPDDWQPKKSSPVPAIIAGLVIVAVLAGGFVGWQAMAKKKEAARQAASADSARAAAMDSLRAAAQADSLARATGSDSLTAAKRDSTPTPTATSTARPPSGSATASASAARPSTPAASGGTAAKPRVSTPSPSSGSSTPSASSSGSSGYGILAGSYLMEERAASEKDRLATATGLTGLVRSSGDTGSLKYDVILGRFSSRAEAERRAGALVEAGTLSEAQVVARPK